MLYQLGIWLYSTAYQLIASFHFKAKKRLEGISHNTFLIKNSKKRVWIHCASAGEYEQAIPIIIELRKIREIDIIVSFFSPSGVEHYLKNPLCDGYFYLPFDQHSTMKAVVKSVDADIAIWIKYEFWFNTLNLLKLQGTKLILADAVLDQLSEKSFFSRNHILKCLSLFDYIFSSSGKLDTFQNVTLAPDTKWIQAFMNKRAEIKFEKIQRFLGQNKVFIAGSTHKKDLFVLKDLIPYLQLNGFKTVIVPHETDEKEIHLIKKVFNQYTLTFSSSDTLLDKEILVIDQKGLLKILYQYADITYIGGGFDKAVHNVLEPSAYGKPVFCGPKLNGIPETALLIEKQILFPIHDSGELKKHLSLLDEKKMKEIALRSKKLFEEQISGNQAQLIASKIVTLLH